MAGLTLKSIVYRFSQGWRALTAWSRPLDLSPAQAILGAELMVLFTQMRRSEQLHSLRVLVVVRSLGHSDPQLLAAALLHDVGKSHARMGLVGRTLVVAVGKLMPGLYGRWSKGEARGWRKPFVVAVLHAEWGAQMVERAGAAEMVVALVRRHEEHLEGKAGSEEERLLGVLQVADGMS